MPLLTKELVNINFYYENNITIYIYTLSSNFSQKSHKIKKKPDHRYSNQTFKSFR